MERGGRCLQEPCVAQCGYRTSDVRDETEDRL